LGYSEEDEEDGGIGRWSEEDEEPRESQSDDEEERIERLEEILLSLSPPGNSRLAKRRAFKTKHLSVSSVDSGNVSNSSSPRN